MAKVEVYQSNRDGQAQINVQIKGKDATVADLLEAWQPLCDDVTLYKSCADNHYAVCKGCKSNCCNNAYVMPDIISFKKMACYLNLSYEEFISSYFQKDKVRAGLLKIKTDPCVFLKDNICTIYPFRSLICRFYLCSPMAGAVEQLIYSLCWSGIAATLLWAEKSNWIPVAEQSGLSSMDLMFKRLLEDYRNKEKVSLFINASDYSDLPLFPFLDEYTLELYGNS
jgi:Fe-S-cluster containining protein